MSEKLKGNIPYLSWQVMIKVENLSIKYGRRDTFAVKNLSFELKDGEILGFVGLNGAGKTSTIRAIAGVLSPSSGHIIVDGHDLETEKVEAALNIGWVPEIPNFEMDKRSIPTLLYYAGFYGIKGDRAKRICSDVIRIVGLEESVKKKLRKYSQGMMKRFAIASAILHEPKNLLMDETLNGLDPEGMDFITNFARGYRDKGNAVLLSTHILDELEHLASRVLIIHKGELIESVAMNRIRETSEHCLIVGAEPLDAKLKTILEAHGSVKVANNKFMIEDFVGTKSTVAEIDKELSVSGYRVYSLEMKSKSLQEYFMDKVKK